MHVMVTLERLPLDGVCIALNPPGHASGVDHMVGVTAQRAALRRPRCGGFRSPTSTAGAAPYWPRHGVIRTAHDGQDDRPNVSALRDLLNGFLLQPLRSGRDIAAMAGNHVILGWLQVTAHPSGDGPPTAPDAPEASEITDTSMILSWGRSSGNVSVAMYEVVALIEDPEVIAVAWLRGRMARARRSGAARGPALILRSRRRGADPPRRSPLRCGTTRRCQAHAG